MQAEATDSSLREGIGALDVKDTETPAAGREEETNTEQQDTEMTAATEEDTTPKDEKGNSIKTMTYLHIESTHSKQEVLVFIQSEQCQMCVKKRCLITLVVTFVFLHQ